MRQGRNHRCRSCPSSMRIMRNGSGRICKGRCWKSSWSTGGSSWEGSCRWWSCRATTCDPRCGVIGEHSRSGGGGGGGEGRWRRGGRREGGGWLWGWWWGGVCGWGGGGGRGGGGGGGRQGRGGGGGGG